MAPLGQNNTGICEQHVERSNRKISKAVSLHIFKAIDENVNTYIVRYRGGCWILERRVHQKALPK